MQYTRTTTMAAVNEATGKAVHVGDTVTSFRGEKATLVRMSRPRIPGKSGKVVVRWIDGGYEQEYYDGVFGLIVGQGTSAFEVAVADYFRTAELYAEYGAADTEPSTVFALMVKAVVDGDKVTNPRSVRGWELYSTMPGATRAAKALHAAAALVIKAAKADLPAARAYVAEVF